jgi:uncharacterized protein (DUF1015 family)
MARIYPFRAWRYNPSQVSLGDVVTQPYDKISPAMQQAYYQKSPYNLVRVILGLPELTDAQTGETVYSRAAGYLKDWKAKGILAQEQEPCIFAYSQRFTVPGTEIQKERRGFIALGHVHDYAEKIVYRHEQTLSKPKGDRLNLLKATRSHFGQIFMLYSDPAGSIDKILYEDPGTPDGEVTDEYNVLHRFWRVSDPATIHLLATAMADKKLIIADGHHRYETALNYSKEHAPSQPVAASETSSMQLPQPPYPEAAVMMTFVNMDSDGLVVLPTHRVVHSLKNFDSDEFFEAAAEYFNIDILPHYDASQFIDLLKRQSGTAFIAVMKDRALLLRSKAEVINAALADQPERQRNLDLTHLHSIILDKLLGLDAEKVREQTNIRYLRSAESAVAQPRAGEADITFLTNPVTMDQLREVAFAGDVMPQKSTDFFPKLMSGLTIYSLD